MEIVSPSIFTPPNVSSDAIGKVYPLPPPVLLSPSLYGKGVICIGI